MLDIVKEFEIVGWCGTVLSALGTWVGVSISGVLTWKVIRQTRQINQQQMETKKYELKIALHEKRYHIYNVFCEIYHPAYGVLEKHGFAFQGNFDLCSELDLALPKVTNTNFTLAAEEFRTKYYTVLQNARFCFEEEISRCILDFATLLPQVAYTSDIETMAKKETLALIETVQRIENEHILQKMEDELTIIFKDIAH